MDRASTDERPADERKSLGECGDIGAIDKLLTVRGLRVVDVGCGAGRVSRELVERGAEVLGVEPDPIQAEKNRQAPPVAHLRFVETHAETLPAESGSMDGVFFFRSLHHVPAEHMADALREAARVLKPATGFLWIVEPGMEGTHFPVMRPFHDETRVRNLAQAALAETAAILFDRVERFRFMQYPSYPDFDSFVTRVTGQTYNDVKREKVETDAVRALFEQGRTDGGGYRFEQPMLLNLYRGPKRG